MVKKVMEEGVTSDIRGVFKDIDHYKVVVKNLMRQLSHRRDRKKESELSYEYFYYKVNIVFSTSISSEELQLCPYESKITLMAPKRRNESTTHLANRRVQYLGELLKYMDAMRTLSMTQIYSILEDDGKEKLAKRS